LNRLTRAAIVGFPNVGKSTLFNRLLKQKRSLVHSLPGMTRDWVAASCRLEDKEFTLVDTGGFFDFEQDPFSRLVKEKAWEASQDADILIFVLDGKRDLLPAEKELYFSLKKLNKPVLVVINKVDSLMGEEILGDFFQLGNESIIPISAEHKRNIGILEEALKEILPAATAVETECSPLRIALVGRINVGKSSIVNMLSGQEKLIVSQIPGTTRDSTDTLIYREKKAFCLVDTAGIRKLSRTRDNREKAGIIKAKKDIMRADVVCLVMDAQEFPVRQDTAIAHLAYDSGKPLIIALNKWDLINKENKPDKHYKVKVYEKMDFIAYAPLLFTSALSGKRIIKILDLAEEVYTNASKRITTSSLNNFLSRVSEEYPPLSRKKTRIKIKYMTQQNVFPPTFILFTHSAASFSPAYEKYFIHRLRENLGLQGTPIRIHLRQN